MQTLYFYQFIVIGDVVCDFSTRLMLVLIFFFKSGVYLICLIIWFPSQSFLFWSASLVFCDDIPELWLFINGHTLLSLVSLWDDGDLS